MLGLVLGTYVCAPPSGIFVHGYTNRMIHSVTGLCAESRVGTQRPVRGEERWRPRGKEQEGRRA